MDFNQLITAGIGMIRNGNGLAHSGLKRYAAPTLNVYGGVIDLTASGTQAGSEGTGSGNITKKN